LNIVEPIRNEKDIEKIKNELIKHNYRDYFLFLLGINTGLRLSILLNLKFKDFIIQGKNISLNVNNIQFPLNASVKECFFTYKQRIGYKEPMVEDYIFASRKGHDPIDRSHAYRILSEAAKKVGLSSKVGTSTLRKTFGYHFYKKYGDLKYLQKMFNHSSSKQTIKYIGISEEDIPVSVIELNL